MGILGTSLVIQWLRLHPPNAGHAGGMGSIPGQGTKTSYAMWLKKKKKKECGILEREPFLECRRSLGRYPPLSQSMERKEVGLGWEAAPPMGGLLHSSCWVPPWTWLTEPYVLVSTSPAPDTMRTRRSGRGSSGRSPTPPAPPSYLCGSTCCA